jgi:hypothetical protein
MNIYDTHLRVKPFITAPLGDRQQSFLLVHSDFSWNWEAFAGIAHSYDHRIHPTLPIACQIYRYGGHVLLSMTIQSQANELASNRQGSQICLGALLHVDAFALPQIPGRVFIVFEGALASATGLNFDRDGISTWSLMIQGNPTDPLSSSVVNTILQTFEHEFGVVPQRRNPWRVITCVVRAIRFLWRTSDIVTAADVEGAFEYWRSVDEPGRNDEQSRTPANRAATAAKPALSVVILPPISLVALVAARRILADGAAAPGFVLALVALLLVSAAVTGVSMSFAGDATQRRGESNTRYRIAAWCAAVCGVTFIAQFGYILWYLWTCP